MINKLSGKKTCAKLSPEQYHSVEFSFDDSADIYQFRIWGVDSTPLSILIKQDSTIISRLQVGQVLNTRYYSNNSSYPSECMKTVVQHITKKDKGRLKGHYLAELEIL